MTPGANDLVALGSTLPQSTARGIEFVSRVEEIALSVPQVEITTYHVIHAGIYSRTICIPKGVVLTGALIKVPTTLVINGRAWLLVGDAKEVLFCGYRVFAAAAGRKVGYIAEEDTWVTMSFKTNTKTVEEAENEFSDEADRLFSRRWKNETVITGD